MPIHRRPILASLLSKLICIGALLMTAACSTANSPIPVFPQSDPGNIDPGAELMPQADQFAGLPFHLLGEQTALGGYTVKLSDIQLEADSIQVSAELANHSGRLIDLDSAFILYKPDGSRITSSGKLGTLESGSESSLSILFDLPAPIPLSELLDYRLLYTPFGWSGPVFMYLLVDKLPESSPQPGQIIPESTVPEAPGAYNGVTGDPWKMLILIYPDIDTDYIEGGVSKHLTASMPAADVTAMRNDFMDNQPHRDHVYDYSDHTGEMEAHVIVVDHPLTDLEPIGEGYWPSPAVTAADLDLYAPNGKYDSVIVFWQASDPDTGQSLPTYGWGLGYWPYDYANGMTYATVFNISWVWPSDACHGEVFLHEWLHGVTGFYMYHLGFPFNVEDLHGAEEAGYTWDFTEDGCWDNWLRAYMRGLVYEDEQRKALVPATWQSGSITTHLINGWRGEYFNNTTLTDIPVLVRDDAAINFQWQSSSPHPLVISDGNSARWTRTMDFTAGVYTFYINHDDGGRLFIDDELMFEDWCDNCWETGWVNISLNAGPHKISMEMWENLGWSAAILTWDFAELPFNVFLPVLKK
jgi:hypothetical protein